MGDHRDIIDIAVWAADSQLPTLAALREVPSIRVQSLGGESNDARRFAEQHTLDFVDDPRLLAMGDARAVLIMNPAASMEDEIVQAMAAAARQQGRTLFSLIPRPGLDIGDAERRSPESRPVPVPCFSDTTAGRRFTDAASAFGRPLTASIDVTGADGDPLLHARLFDAIDTLAPWFGLPARVQATAVYDDEAPSRPMRRLLAQLSFADGRAASIAVGTAPGALQRDVALQGDAGRLAYSEGRTTWRSVDGRDLESGGAQDAAAPSLAEQIAEAVAWHVGGASRSRDHDTWEGMMAACEAVLLSARTGNAEVVDSVRRMLGRV